MAVDDGTEAANPVANHPGVVMFGTEQLLWSRVPEATWRNTWLTAISEFLARIG